MNGYRVLKSNPPHPADGLTAIVEIGDGAATAKHLRQAIQAVIAAHCC